MNDLVWVATVRADIAFHLVAGRHTACGRYVGDVVAGLPEHGRLLTEDEALALPGSACRQCHGDRRHMQPVVIPRAAA